jgi:tungstate transport system substrate-binding protein
VTTQNYFVSILIVVSMQIQRRKFIAALGGGALAGIAGCSETGDGQSEEGSSAGVAGETLTLRTTTSTYDTGLLDGIHPDFQQYVPEGWSSDSSE